MKTLLKTLLLIVMIGSLVGIFYGAYHQIVILAMASVVYATLLDDKRKESNKIYPRTFEMPE